MFDDLPSLPAPASEEAPPPATPVAPGQVNLFASNYLFALNQPVTLTVRLDDDGNSVEGFTYTLSLPISLTVVDGSDGTASQSRERQSLSWLLPAVSGAAPFERQVVVQANAGNPGDGFRLELTIGKEGYESSGLSLLVGLGNPNNHELFVLLDPQSVAEGVSVVSAPLSETVTGTVAAAEADLLDVACGAAGVECWGAGSSLSDSEWIDAPAESINDEIPSVEPDVNASQRVYLPVISGGNETSDRLQGPAQANDNPANDNSDNNNTGNNNTGNQRKAVKPKFTDGGVAFQKLWRIHAKKLGKTLEKLDRPATLIFSAKKLIKAGIDPRSIQLWTRPEDASANSLWRNVNLYYDEPNQLIIAVTRHFSNWGLGSGISSTGQTLPSLRSFSNDLFSGSANINVPIEAPKGLGGMSPGLSLSYNSRTADDVVNGLAFDYQRGVQSSWAGGYGWNLGGISSIQRSPYGYFMVLNGMAVNLVSTGGNSYRTDPEMFLKITHAGGGLGGNTCPGFTRYCDAEPWTVQTPDGTTYYFGSPVSVTGVGNTYLNITAMKQYTAILMQSHLNTPGSTQTNWYIRQTGSKWYLRQAVDTLGNRIDYNYDAETSAYSSSCAPFWAWSTSSGSATLGNTEYVRATYLRSVYWSGNNNGEQTRMRIWLNRTPRTAPEKEIQNWNYDCAQAQYSDERLSEILVDVRTGGDWNPGNFHTLRRYALTSTRSDATSPVLNSCTTAANACHVLLTGLHLYGKNGTDLLQSYSFSYGGSLNQIRLTSANNGMGGQVSYSYGTVEDFDTGSGACIGAYWTCIIDNPPYGGTNGDGDRWRRHYSLSSLTTYDGLGNNYLTSFAYNGTHKAIMLTSGLTAQGTLDDFESLGHSYASVKTSALNNSATIVREEEHRFHQVNGTARDPRRGKEYQTQIWNGAKSAGKMVQQVDTTWSDNSGWVRQDSVTTTVCAPDGGSCANKQSIFTYAASLQGGVQHGNVTNIADYSNGALLRNTQRVYFPNNTKNIFNLVSQEAVADATGTCMSQTNYVYGDDKKNGSWAQEPSNSLVSKIEVALTNCDGSYPPPNINTYDANWSITRFAHDAYGNTTTVNQTGVISTSDDIIKTTYDSTFHLFPIEQWKNQDANFKEYAEYYGVNANDQSGTIPLSDARSVWGAMAEHCGVNGVCTRQSYDVFGRATNRWAAVAKDSNWDLTPSTFDSKTPPERAGFYKSANINWTYKKPGELGSNNTYVVTEWHSPRCYGNFVRSHYNGLGQLMLEQRPYQDWQHKVDSCGTADNAGTEIHTNFGYNSLGQQNRVGVPESQPRSAYDDAILADSTRWTGKTFNLANFDPIGRPVDSYAANGEHTTHGYAGFGHATFQISRDSGIPNKVVRWEATDLYGQLLSVETYNWGGSTWVRDSRINLTHDGLGNLTKVVQDLPTSVTLSTMTYDKAGRKLSMNDADLGNWTYAYDRENNLTRQTDGNSWATCLYYDNVMERLVGKYFQYNNNLCPAAPAIYHTSYGYDAGHVVGSNASRGQLTSIGTNDGHYGKSITYNAQGMLKSETVSIGGAPSSYTTQYGYDAYLRPSTTTYPGDSEVLTTQYNSMGLPATLSSSSNGILVDGPVVNSINQADYDTMGRLRQIRMPSGTPATGDDTWRTQIYEPWSTQSSLGGKLKSIWVGTIQGWANWLDLSYTFDSFGNIKTLTENGTSNSFAYDGQNRVTSAYGKAYGYDATGRMLKYEAAANNQTFNNTFPLHAIKNAGYVYNANGGMVNRPTAGGTQTLTWDHENHLVGVSGGGVNESYSYDADGNRIKVVRNGLTTYQPFPHYQVDNGTVEKYYSFNGQRIAMKRGSVLTYLHNDHLGSPVLTTNASANATQTYNAYGKVRTYSGSFPTRYQFTGQYTDNSSLVYMNARYYDPATGTFISPDTVVPDAGRVSAYNRTMYARGNPLVYNDPSGHQDVCGGVCPAPGINPQTVQQAIQQTVDVARSAGPYAPVVAGAASVPIVAGGGYLAMMWAIQDNGPDYPPVQPVVLPGGFTISVPEPGSTTVTSGVGIGTPQDPGVTLTTPSVGDNVYSWRGQNTTVVGQKSSGTLSGYLEGNSDLTGGQNGAGKLFEQLAGRQLQVGNPTSTAPTDVYIEAGKLEVRFRPSSKSKTPVIEIIDHVAKTIEKIHFNN